VSLRAFDTIVALLRRVFPQGDIKRTPTVAMVKLPNLRLIAKQGPPQVDHFGHTVLLTLEIDRVGGVWEEAGSLVLPMDSSSDIPEAPDLIGFICKARTIYDQELAPKPLATSSSRLRRLDPRRSN
jgi:hypothetical protein